ncbi:MAG: CRTAC1 family protein [Pseudomonadota bacterium]|nr:CRTAC1 family protein [Pseudomonadota bacterium]
MSLIRRKLGALAALALVAVLFWLARFPTLPQVEAARLVERFSFTRMALPDPAGYPHKEVRAVHPSLERISAWISSVGAAVALADLDGDGLANDLCHVDPRTDRAIVSPAPGTGERYAPFALDPSSVGYDPATMAPMGCLTGDFNEDGKRDLLVYYWGRTPIAFLRHRNPMAAAAYVAMDVKPGGERWFTNAATLADLDGDGHADLVVGNYFQDGGRILDAKASGVETMHDTKSKSFNGGAKHLLLWAGGGTGAGAAPFVRYQEAAGVLPEAVDRGWALGVAAADLDGDGLPELYFAHDFGPDRLLHNRSTPGHLNFAVLEGKRGFNTPKSFVLGQDSFKGMGVDFGDINGDGMLDIYVSNIANPFALQESHMLWLSNGSPELMRLGQAPYVQASEPLGLSRSGWGWESRLDDFDNDGVLEAVQATGFVKGKVNRWPELQSLGTGNDRMMSDPRHWPKFRPGDDLSGQQPNAFFVRAADGRFYDMARQLGLDEPMVSRGIATADVDGDGDLDFAVANQWEPSYLYRNDCPRCGAFLGLRLMRVGSGGQARGQAGHQAIGYPAIGAQAVVRLPDGRRLIAQVDGGNGHSGKRSQELHFGLGKQQGPVQVEISWRDAQGRMQRATLNMKPGWHTVLLGQE